MPAKASVDSAQMHMPRITGFDRLSALTVAFGALLWWTTSAYPAAMPVIAPWEFSWIEYLGIALPFVWYIRGLRATPAAERPHLLRRIAFFIGVALIYAMMLTHFVYIAQHMFFLNRVQHMFMHHLGPFLIALSWPGETLGRGSPEFALRIARSRPISLALRVLLNPVIGGLLFVGLIWLWLQPDIHFQAMISPRLYDVMNISMVVDGLLFWFLVLDPRAYPAARHSYPVRMITSILVMFPQIAIGSHLTFTTHSLYSYYDLCGRLFPSISPLLDQHIGGIIAWIPSSMMSSVAFLLMLNNIRLEEDRRNGGARSDDIEIAPGVRVSSCSWTGR